MVKRVKFNVVIARFKISVQPLSPAIAGFFFAIRDQRRFKTMGEELFYAVGGMINTDMGKRHPVWRGNPIRSRHCIIVNY